MSMRHSLVAVLLAVWVVAATAGVAAANSPRFTRGDAEAIFNANSPGGAAINLHSPTMEGAPADFFAHGRIGAARSFNGKHLCATDWHLVNIFLGISGDSTLAHSGAVATLDPLLVSWTLDGDAVPSTRTPVKPYTAPSDFGAERAFFFSDGYILAPDELALGEHRSRATVIGLNEPGVPFVFPEVVFHVDPPGSPACA